MCTAACMYISRYINKYTEAAPFWPFSLASKTHLPPLFSVFITLLVNRKGGVGSGSQGYWTTMHHRRRTTKCILEYYVSGFADHVYSLSAPQRNCAPV